MRWLAGSALLVATLFGAHAGPSTTQTDDLTGRDFTALAQRHIAAREYWASPTEAGLQAPNRKHDLRTFFEPTGVRVHERTGGGNERLVELRLAGIGRGDALAPVAAGEVSHREGRVEIRRAGVTEWYENSPRGLEQGFTLAERPASAAPGELVLELAVAGARAGHRGDSVALATDAGRKLAYGKLAVADASGRALAARFEVPSPDRVRLVVDDAGAPYPIVVDPLLEETADTFIHSGQDFSFLISVASAGDVNGDGYDDIIIGAHEYDAGAAQGGAAFVFLGSASGIADSTFATADALLEPLQSLCLFGWSVASAGDVNGDGYDDVIVGAYQYDAGQTNEGAAFVFLGSASGIADGTPATANAQLESDQNAAQMGVGVASAGDVNGDGYDDVIVLASSYDAGQTNEGAAFVFLGSASGIADGNPATAHAQLETNQAGVFMDSAASAGDVNGDGYDDVIVGSDSYVPGATDTGAAFIFHGSASGIADGSPATADTQILGGRRLGVSVAPAGDVNGDGYGDVIVGDAFYEAGEGAAYVFLGSASGVADGGIATADAQLESDQFNAFMGETVASAGDVNCDGYADVIVLSRLYNAGENDEGAAFVWLGSATGVADGNPATAYAQLETNQPSASLRSVASAGDIDGDGCADVIISAYLYDQEPDDTEGAAWVYLGGATGIRDANPASAHTQLESDQDGASLGVSVASAGDVNADGYTDAIVGAPAYDAGESGEGAAFLFHGSASGIADAGAATAAAQLEADQVDAGLGRSVASAGDVDGDGYADVIVGAPAYDAGESDEGAAFVFRGSASGVADATPATAHARLESDQADAGMGASASAAGDVDGDGFGDVIVGARGYDAGETDEGAAFVFRGSASGIANGTPATAGTTLEADQAGAELGGSVASAGDVNGDGYADVLAGAALYDAGESDEGAAFIFLGSASGIANATPATAHARLESDQADALLGASGAAAGDVDGDGFGDVIVGARGYDAGETDEGAAFVFLGSASGIANGNPATADATLEADQAGAGMGQSVATAGDVDADGYGDVIVGADGYDAGQSDEGAAFVFLGSASGVADATPATAHAQLEADQASSGMGTQVASAGDVNGDGFADVIVGAPAYDGGESDEGAAFVFLGNSGGRARQARQLRGNGSGIAVQPWGSSGDTAFLVSLRGSHPDGVGRVRAEVEACPAGVAFGNPACTSSLSPAWVPLVSGTSDALLTAGVTGPQTFYRWRARVLHADLVGALPPEPGHGPWTRVGAQAVEADIRTVPEPGAAAAWASGIALLAYLQRRRRR